MATRCLRQSIITSYLELKDPSRRDLGKMGYFTLPGSSPSPPTAMAILDFVDKITKATYRKTRTGRLEGDSPLLTSLSVGSSGVRNEVGPGCPE